MNLVLIGYRGTGKSGVALRLGRELGRPVVSLDQEIVTLAGQPIPAIVAQHGWSHFRDLEERVCREFSEKDGLIIDCGGGVVEREANFAVLRDRGRIFWLTATPATIAGRIGGDTNRPSLTGAKSFVDEIVEVLERRTPLYHRLAHVEVATDGRTMDDIAAQIARDFGAVAPRAPRY